MIPGTPTFVATERSGNALVIILVVVLVVAVGLFLLYGNFVGSGSDEAGGGSAGRNGGITHTVKRERLVVTVTEDGKLESGKNVDVKCQIEGGSAILWIIPDGTYVTAGEKLVELDSSGIEEQFRTQQGITQKAIASKIKAVEDWEAAKIAVEEYEKGIFEIDVQNADSLITVAEENLRSAQNILEHSERMARKGFSTPLQLEADEFAVKRARLDLASAEKAKVVLEKYTKDKTLKQLEATRGAAEALAKAEESAVALEQSKLDRLEAQLSKCVIHAPSDGMVVYYKERGRFSSSSATIEEGAAVRERQTIIQLPDLAQMQATVPIHESRVEQIKPGKRAHLKILERSFTGVVESIANQPESKSFFQAQVMEYPTRVRIVGNADGLRPGMTAEVEILIDSVDDVLTVPVPAVVERDGEFFAWVVKKDGQQEKRKLLLGLTNDEMVEIKDGLAEGDEVLLNPRAMVAEASEANSDSQESVNLDQKFGDAKPTTGAEGASGPNGAKPAAGGGQRPRMSFKDLDKNSDGKLTSDEFPPQMPSSAFEAMDTDKDGSVSPSEHAEAAKKRAQQGQGGRPAGGAPKLP